MGTTDDLHRLRQDLRSSLLRARRAARELAGSPHELRTVMLAEALERAHRDLSGLLHDAERPSGLWGGRGPQGTDRR